MDQKVATPDQRQSGPRLAGWWWAAQGVGGLTRAPAPDELTLKPSNLNDAGGSLHARIGGTRGSGSLLQSFRHLLGGRTHAYLSTDDQFLRTVGPDNSRQLTKRER